MAEHIISIKTSTEFPGSAELTIRTTVPLCELRAAEERAEDYEDPDIGAAMVMWMVGASNLYTLPIERPVSGCRCSRCARARVTGDDR